MKNAYILLFLIAFVLFAACTHTNEHDTSQEDQTLPQLAQDVIKTPVVPEPNTEPPDISCDTEKKAELQDVKPDDETISEPVTVSPLAKEDFLTPFDNYSWEREYAPEYVVLHFTSAVMVLRDDPYNMDAMRKIFADGGVSPHYIVDRDGSILCFIPEDRAAWHAGKGSYGGDERLTDAMNKYSIGIEIAAMGSAKDMSIYMSEEEYNKLPSELIGFTDSQYDALKLLVGDICKRYSIPFDSTHVIGHDMYSERKTDPGELFDWARIFE